MKNYSLKSEILEDFNFHWSYHLLCVCIYSNNNAIKECVKIKQVPGCLGDMLFSYTSLTDINWKSICLEISTLLLGMLPAASHPAPLSYSRHQIVLRHFVCHAWGTPPDVCNCVKWILLTVAFFFNCWPKRMELKKIKTNLARTRMCGQIHGPSSSSCRGLWL